MDGSGYDGGNIKCEALPGEVVFQQGTPGDMVYIILSGSIELSQSTTCGDIVQVQVLGPGEVFGEMAVLDDQSRSATATALETTQLRTMTRDAFLGQLAHTPPVARQVIGALCDRLRRQTAESTSLKETWSRTAIVGPAATCAPISPTSQVDDATFDAELVRASGRIRGY